VEALTNSDAAGMGEGWSGEEMTTEEQDRARRLRAYETAARQTAAKRLCGTCKNTPAKEQILRLRIMDGRRKEFREVRLPYCGNY
jgi:hypothetical protein